MTISLPWNVGSAPHSTCPSSSETLCLLETRIPGSSHCSIAHTTPLLSMSGAYVRKRESEGIVWMYKYASEKMYTFYVRSYVTYIHFHEK